MTKVKTVNAALEPGNRLEAEAVLKCWGAGCVTINGGLRRFCWFSEKKICFILRILFCFVLTSFFPSPELASWLFWTARVLWGSTASITATSLTISTLGLQMQPPPGFLMGGLGIWNQVSCLSSQRFTYAAISPARNFSQMTEDIIIRILLEIWFIKAILLRSNKEMKGRLSRGKSE